MDPKLITPLIVSALVVWALYRRVRRTFGRQPVQPPRLYLRAGILGMIGVLLLASVAREGALLGWLVGGMACGALLALVSLRHTRFEVDRSGRFYTPHAYIGMIILALFLSRLIFRFVTIYTRAAPAAGTSPLAAYEQSPLTLLIVGLLIGYYVLYNLGVLSKARSLGEHQDLMT